MLSNEPKTVLKKYGSSFFWASQFLGKNLSQRIARLYKFCRYVDNLADSNQPDRAIILKDISNHLVKNDGRNRPKILYDFMLLADECALSLNTASELMAGMLSDQDEVEINNETDLLRYCHAVAGTVGVMSKQILQCSNPQATYYAIDLGIAMQLTNIARDVLEDAKNSRRYIPESWLNLEPLEIAKMNNDKRPMVSEAINRLVKLADVYYESAMTGIYHIPWRSRIAIVIALRLYRQIGVQLVKNGSQWWKGRTIVKNHNKFLLTIYSMGAVVPKKVPPHNLYLHEKLHGLDGVHEL